MKYFYGLFWQANIYFHLSELLLAFSMKSFGIFIQKLIGTKDFILFLESTDDIGHCNIHVRIPLKNDSTYL